MSKNIWKELKKPFFVLAPMEDVTDSVFRHVIKKAASPDLFFTEFTNSASYTNDIGKESLKGRLYFTEDEKPIIGHIWGDNPEDFKAMSFGLKEMGYQGIDINMGCPAPNVFKHGRGSGLILRPEVAAELIEAAKSSGLPVSVKTRLGHSSIDEWKEWLTHLLKQDIANLTVHLRTKTEMSKVDAHYELIPDIIKLRDEIAPDTLITINGDILNYTEGKALADKYNIDGIMIGRGVFKNPFAFNKEGKEYSAKDHLDLLNYHWDTYDEYTKKEPLLKRPLHRFYKVYIHEFRGASDLRVKLMETKSTDEARKVLHEFKQSEDYTLLD